MNWHVEGAAGLHRCLGTHQRMPASLCQKGRWLQRVSIHRCLWHRGWDTCIWCRCVEVRLQPPINWAGGERTGCIAAPGVRTKPYTARHSSPWTEWVTRYYKNWAWNEKIIQWRIYKITIKPRLDASWNEGDSKMIEHRQLDGILTKKYKYMF